MHIVTVCLIFAGLRGMMLHLFEQRAAKIRDEALISVRNSFHQFLGLAVCFGLVGTGLGLLDVGAAISSAPPEAVPLAAVKGLSYASISTTWSLLGAGCIYSMHLVFGRVRKAQSNSSISGG